MLIESHIFYSITNILTRYNSKRNSIPENKIIIIESDSFESETRIKDLEEASGT